MGQVVEKIRPYLLGWKVYFGLAQTPAVWLRLDEWLRHRLRAIQLKHWRRPGTIYRELKALGAKEDVARQVAANNRRWWRNSNRLLKISNRPVRTRMPAAVPYRASAIISAASRKHFS
ncbi:MAG: group II intron maturase-specific domain-containing protein [Zoogloea sp.]|nr:group II intron maturase-specific domain-containing protein [Zoogloea sp.]MDD3352582.1 group II intron maturase-specific domain-containing protein [Zoogloea sp.]